MPKTQYVGKHRHPKPVRRLGWTILSIILAVGFITANAIAISIIF